MRVLTSQGLTAVIASGSLFNESLHEVMGASSIGADHGVTSTCAMSMLAWPLMTAGQAAARSSTPHRMVDSIWHEQPHLPDFHSSFKVKTTQIRVPQKAPTNELRLSPCRHGARHGPRKPSQGLPVPQGDEADCCTAGISPVPHVHVQGGWRM